MMPRRIAGTTHVLGAPKDWNAEKDGECSRLAVRASAQWCESAWEPTPEELAMINAGGSIILRVWGGQPPVALYVETQAESG